MAKGVTPKFKVTANGNVQTWVLQGGGNSSTITRSSGNVDKTDTEANQVIQLDSVITAASLKN